MKRYEQFPHTADIGIRAYGKDLKELFANAAFAMFDTIADLEGLKAVVTQNFELKAENKEELLVAFLQGECCVRNNEPLVYLFRKLVCHQEKNF